MNISSDFDKYARSNRLSSQHISSYIRKNNIGLYDHEPINAFSKLLENRILLLTGEIDDYLCDVLKIQLQYLEHINGDDITIQINSPGGDVYGGLGLIDVMEYIKPDIQTINTGLAASMAAVILCSGEKGKRKALKRSRTMIHQPLGYGGWKQASDMEIEAREMSDLKKELYDIISDRTGQKYDKVYKDGDRDYWMTAKIAKEYGMIDDIILKRKK